MGLILDGTAYEWDLSIPCYSADRYDRLKVSALLRLQQEVGEKHIFHFGTTSEMLRDRYGVAFIITKSRIKVNRLPGSEEPVRLTTWCSSLKGIRFMRNYTLKTPDGEVLTESKAEVIMINLKDRTIVRPKDVDYFKNYLYNSELANSCGDPKKIDAMCTGEEYERTIRFSDIDYNGHMNNTVYADIMFDFLPSEFREKAPKEVAINFKNELLEGETMDVFADAAADTVTFCGTCGGTDRFAGMINY